MSTASRPPATEPPADPRSYAYAPTTFVGRKAELEDLRTRLDGDGRLLTLVGPGGIGKSRLALEAARRREGVVVCDLSATSTPDEALSAIAVACRFNLSTRVGPERREMLFALLDEHKPLLLLDTFDALVPAANETVGVILARTEHVRVLVTSREPLGLLGEHVIQVAPLAAADVAELFLDRARAASSTFDAAHVDRRLLEEIAEVTSGIPLAVELCAGRISLLPLEELVARARESLDLFQDKAPDRPRRHHSLRAALAASWDLLSDGGRAALARCSVFRGSFSARAAESVLGLPKGTDVLSVLDELVGKSLIQPLGQGRLRVLDTVRAFAAEHLADEDRQAGRERHRAWFADLARTWAEGPDRFGEAAVLRLAQETDNLLHAFEHAEAEGHVDAAHLALALHPRLLAQGPHHKHRAVLERAHQIARQHGEARLAVECALRQAEADRSLHLTEPALAHLDAADVDAKGLGGADADLKVLLQTERARCYLLSSRWAEAHEAAQAAVKAVGDRSRPFPLYKALAVQASTAMVAGQFDQGEQCASEALALARRAGDSQVVVETLIDLAVMRHWRGDFSAARTVLLEADEVATRIGSLTLATEVKESLALVEMAQGRLASAEGHLHDARQLSKGGRLIDQARLTGERGVLHALRGEHEPAMSDLEDAAVALREVDAERLRGVYRSFLALTAAIAGDAAKARSTLEEAKGLLEGGPTRTLADVATIAVEAVERRAKGSTLPVDDLVRRVKEWSQEKRPELSAVLATFAAALAEQAVGAARAGGVLVVEDPVFTLAGGDPIDLGNAAAPRRILLALLDAHHRQPGHLIETEALFEAGWPGEKALPDARRNRVQVAISTLRRRGLRDALVAEKGSYGLRSDLLVQVKEG